MLMFLLPGVEGAITPDTPQPITMIWIRITEIADTIRGLTARPRFYAPSFLAFPVLVCWKCTILYPFGGGGVRTFMPFPSFSFFFLLSFFVSLVGLLLYRTRTIG